LYLSNTINPIKLQKEINRQTKYTHSCHVVFVWDNEHSWWWIIVYHHNIAVNKTKTHK